MMTIIERLNRGVKKGKDVYIAPSASVFGYCDLGDDSSIWHSAVLRGDVEQISVGDRSNVQDGSVLHVTTDKWKCIVGNDTSIGHGVVLHGCTIGNNVLVGIGSIILDGAVVGDNCIIGAGSLIPPGKVIPPRSMVMGSPYKIVRELNDDDIANIRSFSDRYVNYKNIYLDYPVKL